MAIDQITGGLIKNLAVDTSHLAAGAVETAKVADDAVTGAKVSDNLSLAGNLAIADGGTIGTATDADAITIAAAGNVTLSQNLIVTGTLTVNGTQTTLNTATLEVEDKDITIAKVSSPSDTTADGAGIIIKGASDKTILWQNATDSFDINQHIFPSADNTKDLGSATKRWRNIYTGDLHLANDRGNWTVIEEEDYLTLRNNNTNKVFKLLMEEVE